MGLVEFEPRLVHYHIISASFDWDEDEDDQEIPGVIFVKDDFD